MANESRGIESDRRKTLDILLYMKNEKEEKGKDEEVKSRCISYEKEKDGLLYE